jgi:pimeloyl-ACP methyl ester carboxylesterase
MSAIVYVHGMWMPAIEMAWLRKQLASKHQLPGDLFGYPSVRGTLDENAALLASFVHETAGQNNVDLVGHSLGGVLALRMLALIADAPVGRVVCVGSPLCGSSAARVLSLHEWGRAILGKSVVGGVARSPASEWAGDVVTRHEVGIIAGTISAGLGRLVTTLDGPNDGTVAVAETKLPGAKDHVSVAASHSSLVLSRDVAMQIATFLGNGNFARDA